MSTVWNTPQDDLPRGGLSKQDKLSSTLKVIAVFDNGGKTVDRYTIVFDEVLHGDLLTSLGCSDNAGSPNGFCQWGEFYRRYCSEYQDMIGDKIRYAELPEDVQEMVRRRVREDGTQELVISDGV